METLATIFDIQRFSIHDGPGIRTTIFFKGCPLRCLWCQNPESHKPGPEVAFYEERCVGCFTCKEVCPVDGIVEARDVRIDGQKCTACGKCVSACENNALRMVGADWEPHSLFSEIVKDKDFFMDSGGGITLSGGEPAIHSAFLWAFLPLVKEQGIHVNMETCGMFKFEDVERILPLLDLIYYDLKLIDPETHKRYTGADNRNIMGNFAKLAKTFPNLQARMPVVPTINDGPENILGTVQLLKKNNLSSIHLLSYNKLGEDKLRRIETDLRPLNLPRKDSKALLSAKKLFENESICAIVSD
ncbi:MAG: glycyl-radical enzyme activating protein [Desulfobacteraceae bacterium]